MSNSSESSTTSTIDESDLTRWLVERVRFYDQVDPATVTADAPLTELGLDSIYVLTLCGDIEDSYGLSIDPTFFADYATLGDLGEALAQRISSS